jgi:TolA-binding protein
MSCPSGARLAAAASGEDRAAADHAATCSSCAAALAREQATRALAAGAPAIRLGSARRAAMRASLLARSDAMFVPGQPRADRRRAVVGLGLVAAAAVIAIALGVAGHARSNAADPVARGSAGPGSPAAPIAPAASGGTPGTSAPEIVREAPRAASADLSGPPQGAALTRGAAPTQGAAIESRGARLQQDGDAVRVTDGAVTIDARGRRTTEVRIGAARVTVADAQVRVVARASQLLQVKVLAGSAEVAVARQVWIVDVGEVWRAPLPAPPPPLPPAPAPRPVEPPARSAAVDAFRIGWEALSAGRHADAIAAFDRATDPRVREDASYWAAVAAARAGDDQDARRRLRAFLAAFPSSPRAAEARAALEAR